MTLLNLVIISKITCNIICLCLYTVNIDANAMSEVSATCMEAINYFCEMQLSKGMIQMRKLRGGADNLDWQDDFTAGGNAILSLPTQEGFVQWLGQWLVQWGVCIMISAMISAMKYLYND